MKIFSHIFYKAELKWLGKEKFDSVEKINLMVMLNHTSLAEPLLIRFAPWRLVWALSWKLVVPGADTTLQRPIVGPFLKSIMPGCIPISRKNDHSWLHFLSYVNEKVLTAILPEGRMKRLNGLDKHGEPMTVRGGVADIIECLKAGKMLFVYSGGLHHIQAPGQGLPRLWKTLRVNLEVVDINTYKNAIAFEDGETFKQKVINDMNRRLSECVPLQPQN